MRSNAMPIHYQLRATDFDAGARYLMKNNQLIRQQFIQTEIASITTGMIMILILPYFVFRAQYLLIVLISAVLMTGFFFGFRYYIRKNYIKRFTKISTNDNPDFSRNVSLQLTDNGIASTTDGGTGELFWSSIQSVDEDGRYLYLVLPSPNLIMIPKSAFTSTSSADSFQKTIRLNISQNKNKQ